MKNEITVDSFWDQRWYNIRLPIEVKETNSSQHVREILNVFNLYLPEDSNLNILEIGGAPGGYLAYMARKFGYNVNAIDYSKIGCEKIYENFKSLNIPVTVYNLDIINDDISQIQLFDIVYSLGLVEHFLDPAPIIEKHIKLIKPNGLLILGLPSFLGINKLVLKILKPHYLCWHNLNTMDINNWEIYEEKYGLNPLFKGYIGGWEPRIYMNNCDSFFDRIKNIIIKTIAWNIDRIRMLRKLNSKYWSCYAIAIYRKHQYQPDEGK